MRISSIKEIMSNEKLQMELEKICTQADFEMLCKKYAVTYIPVSSADSLDSLFFQSLSKISKQV